jgi:hypothetical protein
VVKRHQLGDGDGVLGSIVLHRLLGLLEAAFQDGVLSQKHLLL